MKSFFITAPGTGVGKTLVTTALCWQLRQAGKKVTALKPVISGYDPDDQQSDTALILKSCGIVPTKAAVETISPWRFAAPLAPNMAADRERKPQVDLEVLVAFCQDFLSPPPLRGRVREGGYLKKDSLPKSSPPPSPLPQGEGEYLLVEGIGGIMSPVNNHHTVLDWMTALGWPVILVTGTYLGSISHTLMALEILRAQALPVKVLVVSESEYLSSSPRRGEGTYPSLEDTVATLERFLLKPIPVVTIPRMAASGDAWKHVPPISGSCA